MLITAEGRLKHHFWGEYRATIALKFATPELAAQALPQFPDWKQSEIVPSALTFFGDRDAVTKQEDLLVTLGADRRKISSLAKSIDFGEAFTVTVDLTPAGPVCTQGELF